MIVIDANVTHKFVQKDQDYLKVLELINEGRVKICYGGSKQIAEYKAVNAFFTLFIEWSRAGIASKFENSIIDSLASTLRQSGLCKSDDHHIISLLIISRAALICTEDIELRKDIKNKKIISTNRPRIYSRSMQKILIKLVKRK
jgi:hypothetical protein